MITVAVTMALATGAGLTVIGILQDDQADQGAHRQYLEAREAAESGFMEFVNDRELANMLPVPTTENLTAVITPGPGSRYESRTAVGSQSFSGEVRLLRVVSVRESSQSLVRAVVYEAAIQGQSVGQTLAGVEAQVYRMTTNQMGRVAPRIHAR